MTTQYVHQRPSSASFTGKGLLGYSFGPLRQKDLDVYYVDVEKGHDTFMISRRITRTYYILSGEGYFTIADCKHAVGLGMVVEVPPHVEYTYSGRMQLIALSRPRWFRGNDTFTRWNPYVVGADSQHAPDPRSLLTRLVRWRIFGKSPATAYLLLNRWAWHRLPAAITGGDVMRTYGKFLNLLAGHLDVRAQAFSTFFFRNRPQLELIRRLAERSPRAVPLKVAILGCSTGAEAYSVAWTIRSARPDLELIMHAVDISRHAVQVAKGGAYSLTAPQLTVTNILDRMTGAEIAAMFDRDGDVIRVQPWIRTGITWSIGDVDQPEVVEALGQHDIVVANNFLCDMDAPAAEKCLLNIARLLKPAGYVFVSGIDLAVRTRVAEALGWTPLRELLEDIHEGDSSMRDHWPFQYPSLEPLDKRRRDWTLRYAAAFQAAAASATVKPEPEILTVCA